MCIIWIFGNYCFCVLFFIRNCINLFCMLRLQLQELITTTIASKVFAFFFFFVGVIRASSFCNVSTHTVPVSSHFFIQLIIIGCLFEHILHIVIFYVKHSALPLLSFIKCFCKKALAFARLDFDVPIEIFNILAISGCE